MAAEDDLLRQLLEQMLSQSGAQGAPDEAPQPEAPPAEPGPWMKALNTIDSTAGNLASTAGSALLSGASQTGQALDNAAFNTIPNMISDPAGAAGEVSQRVGSAYEQFVAPAADMVGKDAVGLYNAVFPDMSEAEAERNKLRMAERAGEHRARATDIENRLEMLRQASSPGTDSYVGDSSSLVQRGDGTTLDGEQGNFGNSKTKGSFSKSNKPINEYKPVSAEETMKIYQLGGGPLAKESGKVLAELQGKKAETAKPITAEQIDLSSNGTFSPEQEDRASLQMLLNSKNPDASKIAAAALRHRGRSREYIKKMIPTLNETILDKMFASIPSQ